MAQIYSSFEIHPGDSIEKRQENLYLGVISVGEDLYCKGSAVAELNKDFSRLEKVIADMRRELVAIREQMRKPTTIYKCECGQEALIEGQVIGKEHKL